MLRLRLLLRYLIQISNGGSTRKLATGAVLKTVECKSLVSSTLTPAAKFIAAVL